jgi:hypothetical protein
MPHGLKPWKKKIDAILHMDRLRTVTDLCRFLGCINFYRDMWPSDSHMLAPPEMQEAFDKCIS